MSVPIDDDGRPGVIRVEQDDYEEEEDEEDENDDDNEVDDENEDEYESTDYCTDGSSTISSSSSTTNNQPDNTRVCDCCYCEVFGHGVTPMAPTSRNFQEMRERLRKRLSKRREERCQRLQCTSSIPAKANDNETRTDGIGDGGDDTGGGGGGETSSHGKDKRSQKQKNPDGLMGDSTIEEILKFINGTPHDRPSSNSKKKKDSKKENKGSSNKKIKCKPTNTTIASNSKDSDKCLQQSTASNSHQQNNPTNNGEKPPRQKRKDREKAAQKTISTSGKSQQNNIPQQTKVISPVSIASSRESSKSSSSPSTTSDRILSSASQRSLPSRKVKARQDEPRQGDALSIDDCDTSNNISCQSQNDSFDQEHEPVADGELGRLVATAPDDVFKPRDIDLEDDQLDEFERELEAFKRFCLDSISLVKKERLQIKLKDTEWDMI